MDGDMDPTACTKLHRLSNVTRAHLAWCIALREPFRSPGSTTVAAAAAAAQLQDWRKVGSTEVKGAICVGKRTEVGFYRYLFSRRVSRDT